MGRDRLTVVVGEEHPIEREGWGQIPSEGAWGNSDEKSWWPGLDW